MSKDATDFFPASLIAQVIKTNKRQVARIASREHWPRRPQGNLILLRPPEKYLAECRALYQPRPSVAVKIPTKVCRDALRLSRRLACAVHAYDGMRAGQSRAAAIAAVKRRLGGKVGESSVIRWINRLAADGVSGLLDQRHERSGRKAQVAS